MAISLQKAQTLVEKAIEKAAAEFKRPICVAVCDQYGFLLAFGRMDGAPVRSIAISQGKAYTAARIGVNTDAFLERLHRENIPASYFCDEKLTGMPGGSVLKDANGQIVGGAGISGLAPQEDQAIANMMAELIREE
jgi:uncharacterized protein GlcG (DUF336 family)